MPKKTAEKIVALSSAFPAVPPWNFEMARRQFLERNREWLIAELGPVAGWYWLNSCMKSYASSACSEGTSFVPDSLGTAFWSRKYNRSASTPWTMDIDYNIVDNTAIKYHIDGISHAIIITQLVYIQSNQRFTEYITLFNKADEAALIALFMSNDNVCPTLTTILPEGRSGTISLPGAQSWGHLTLSDFIQENVVADVSRFLNSRNWYTAHDLPWRRGYLFYGPPGNGKTSIIKQLMLDVRLKSYTVDMGDPKISNDDVARMFHEGAGNAPALLIMEDVDRLFVLDKARNAKDQQTSQITLQHLLNCMDGIGTGDGLIIVGTANDPKYLDPALRQRPGRFDKLVEFPNPEPAQRSAYFLARPDLSLTATDLDVLTALTDKMSYVQLREVYVNAALRQYELGGELNLDALRYSVDVLRGSMKSVQIYDYERTTGKMTDARGGGIGFTKTELYTDAVR